MSSRHPRRRGVTIGAALLALITAAASQRGTGKDDSPATRDITVATALYLPTTRWNIGESLKEIAEATNVLFGFEAAADATEQPAQRSAKRLSVRGLQVSQALDLLTRVDARYAWRAVNGVINVRPKHAFDDPQHFLHRFVEHSEIRNALPLEATFGVHPHFQTFL